ncbi:MAG: nitric-oxide reductase [Gemmatimonadetes bacterium]|uniref:Nitric-oxide reductase n=1 Tax=Candidatus Kutchimonas denitrificans TaxID=3056748 RepID=A0AAE4ZC96_9BACT|nr:nitric-oxide reductase [Gemmatimonadota bacterium]NIR75791.1 nitric-oxide reductase [Candidatus Kutchimonas denitrificans]NIS01959.1 nitric-oxide reductase [Gemmatimonadota bacterium]NIT67763.1 nitric-oxide reductase [Gemmatimonadota bacterium]NIU53750.1 nitric-oxide reductase [Gemmatimonadota bacterium]
MQLAYRTQRVAYPYFLVALPLFLLQVVVGIWLAASYAFTMPQWLVDALPFGTTRAIHTNLLVLWLLLGFMGSTYFMVPEETERDIFSPRLAYLQLIILAGTGVAAVVGFVFGWTKGRPLLEIPHPLDYLIVVGALIFLFNVGMTMIRGRRFTITQGALLGGLVFLALMYLFNLPFYRNLTIDWYYWWWVIHLWVEGAWELVAAALTAWILMKITGVPRKVVEKWLYVELGLFLFTGIAGTGHHYYWLGAPDYWLWVGGIFSALEPLPIVLMLLDAMRFMRKRQIQTNNRVVYTFATGMAVLHLIGAGVWGFVHTLPMINYYTHGSQITVAHGHLAFFGAYVLLNLMFFYYAIPKLKGVETFKESRGVVAFWWTSLTMIAMTLAFSVAGILQTYIERVMGMGYMTAQAQMRFWFAILVVLGGLFLIGLVILIWDLFRLRPLEDLEQRA